MATPRSPQGTDVCRGKFPFYMCGAQSPSHAHQILSEPDPAWNVLLCSLESLKLQIIFLLAIFF